MIFYIILSVCIQTVQYQALYTILSIWTQNVTYLWY